jgi:hypothetical protein
MQNNVAKQSSPSDVITALLAYLPPEFSNGPENMRETVYKLQKNGYNDLPGDFELIK